MIASYAADGPAVSTGLLIGRLILGSLMIAHGSQKLFGWFGGHGLAGTGGFFESIGFRPGRLFAGVASVTEVVSGLLVFLGLLGPVGPALMVSVMIVAGVTVHLKNGLFAQNGGIELTLLYATAGVALALTGPGLFSLDELFGLQSLWSPMLAWTALVIGVVGGIGNLAARRPAPTA